jgi:hypothetical protein
MTEDDRRLPRPTVRLATPALQLSVPWPTPRRRPRRAGLAGAVHRLDPVGSQLLIDSGGASTELTLTDGHRTVASASLPVGAALLGAEVRGDPPEALSWALGGARIGSVLSLAPRTVEALAAQPGLQRYADRRDACK